MASGLVRQGAGPFQLDEQVLFRKDIGRGLHLVGKEPLQGPEGFVLGVHRAQFHRIASSRMNV